MPSDSNVLGILRPMGGGDPIPLLKAELIIGRRPSCDICLDFANVSGKHCMLRLTNQVWHVRNLGSTNGTTLNGKQIKREESVMPDDELGVASHLFSVDYDPGAAATAQPRAVAVEEAEPGPTRRSLLELAGIADEDKPKAKPKAPAPSTARSPRDTGKIERPATNDVDFEDPLPEHVKHAPDLVVSTSDDDFFKLIEESVIDKKEKP